ncbi:MAG: helix-hairpin-helix domain-containing protein [Acidobacteria bacterium]|nr:helix-hairpin-helix domain-containing protein [Acidobacteriota bacterium]
MKLARILIALFALASFLPAQPAPKKEAAKKEVVVKKEAVKKEAPATTGLIDLNTADAATLKTIPGIGDAYSAKIIANRPYRGKDEIVSKAGVPQATYDKIKDKIIAKQAPAAKKK